MVLDHFINEVALNKILCKVWNLPRNSHTGIVYCVAQVHAICFCSLHLRAFCHLHWLSSGPQLSPGEDLIGMTYGKEGGHRSMWNIQQQKRDKRLNYSHLELTHHFVPVAVETLGVIGPEGRSLF